MLVADHNRCVSRIRFETMIRTLSKILSYLGEDDNFPAIPNIVHRCFEPCHGIVGLNEYQFNCLWKSENIDFGKYSNIIRLACSMKESRHVLHENVKCVACSTNPIQGLRFKCQRCKHFSLCLVCFSSGYATRTHDISHRMYEIASNQCPSNKILSFLSKVANIFLFCSKNSNFSTPSNQTTDMRSQLIKETDDHDMELKSITMNQNLTFNRKSLFDTTETSLPNLQNSPMEKLLEVVEILTTQNELLQKTLSSKNKEILKILQEHTIMLASQIDQLKSIHSKSYAIIFPSSSTPVRQDRFGGSNDISSPLSRSLHGAEMNKTCMDFNKTDMSIKDVSMWFAHRKSNVIKSEIHENSEIMTGAGTFSIETQMINFKDLLFKVKDIVDGKKIYNEIHFSIIFSLSF